MRSLALFLALLFLSFTVHAQETKCSLALDQAPGMRGFRLGMELKQAFELLPILELQPKTDELGHSRAYVFTKYVSDDKKKAYKNILAGVDYISLEFKNDKVAYITISYDGSVKWDNVVQFTQRVSANLRLPLKQWRMTNGTTFINCQSFTVIAEVSNSSATLSLMNNLAMRTPEEVRAAEEEKKRRAFRP